ncbi:uncharacterized protein LOC111479667 isoform X2 [Cucurbita maxima]|uniref:Uncharacterized protein LOC111479667 isoform X2 n=1 Tax=Cucurbita maxima TaxID=3661 RepID=A0A6J1IQU9_CUCMA|nr:uncharacterized protein LOC111479667 isoform X2 [Cucurbita maxima]
MACEAIQLWTFNGLVAAFLDLGIAFLLLCATSLVFFTSKFLALFGSCLPCPCDGLFGDLGSDHCFQKLLVDCSSKKISSVLHSTREKFPLDSMWDQEPKCCFKSMSVHKRNVKEACVEFKCEASGDSWFKTRSPRGMIYGDVLNMNESRYKGGVGGRKIASVSPNDVFQSDVELEDLCHSPSSFCGFGDNNNEDGFFSVDSGDEGEASLDNSNQYKVFPDLELDDSYDEKICAEMYGASAEEARNNCRGEYCLDGNESDRIKLLEQSLEEEQKARATLYLELEKERSAAATAADEAMAMILRLQEEKASIEMEARQYQRMIEEKTAYDAEEMSILKEILVRREQEMHFLKKEVGAFRRSFFDNGGVSVDMLDTEFTPPWLQCINGSITDKQSHELPSVESRNLIFEFGEESPSIQAVEFADAAKARGMLLHQVADNFEGGEEIDELQGKGMVEDKNLYIVPGEVNELEPYPKSNVSNDLGKVEQCTEFTLDEQEKVYKDSLDGLESAETALPCVEYNLEKQWDHQKQWTRDFKSVNDTDACPHDIHVIEDEARMHNEASANAREETLVNGSSSIPVNCDSSSFSLLQNELDITRSSSDATGRFPPMARSRSNSLRSELRRNSMSAVDYERSKIGNEVEWLRGRLKIVQEEREKHKLSVESKEKENNQLQLLENITKVLSDPGKAALQAPLPPSSKDVSKKRCWRSSSLGIHRSS